MADQPLLQPLPEMNFKRFIASGLSFQQYIASIRAQGYDLRGFKVPVLTEEEADKFWLEASARACFESQATFTSAWKWLTSEKFRDDLRLKHYRLIYEALCIQAINAYIARP